MTDSQKNRVLYIEKDPVVAKDLGAVLSARFDVETASSNLQALEMLRERSSFDAVVLEIDEDGGLVEQIRELSPATVRVLLTRKENANLARHAVSSGHVYKYVLRPCTPEELIATVQSAIMENTRTLHKLQLEQEAGQIVNSSERMRSAMMFDVELGIGSPEAMEIELEYAHNVASRYNRGYSITVFDIDMYDSYAKHYGKKAARLAHKLMAEHIRHSCRAADRIYRCGSGIPVLLILPETNFVGASVLCERIVNSFAARNIPNTKSEYDLLTLSSSLSSCETGRPCSAVGWRAMYDEAMMCLQIALNQGGNRVVSKGQVVEEDEPETGTADN